DNAFVENALNVGRGVVRGMLARTSDPERRAELEEALAGIEEAREELRDAGTEVLRAKREALQSLKGVQRATLDAIRKARKETEKTLKEADPADKALRMQLEETLKAAEEAEREAEAALADVKSEKKSKRIAIGPKVGKPSIDIQIDATPPGQPVPPAPPEVPGLELPAPPAAPAPPSLSPEVATRIRRDVTGDMYRIGIGAALLLILLPVFILAVITKFFADRSRASQRVAEAKRKEAEYHRMGQQVTEAKLAALQAQVEPHFLYNTLASVQALTEVDPAKANAMTGHLIQYLRNALPKMRESVSTVGQEVELVRAYLSILQMRMGERLAFDIDVPEALAALPFPPLMLPSLVENAIKHGLEPQREGGRVTITASVEDGRLRLKVADTGRGFGETVGAGVGLANIRERLAALYGGVAHLTLEANEPRGVVATIEVPADPARSSASATPAAPQPAAAQPAAAQPAAAPATPEPPVKVARTGFWAQAWDVLLVLERLWRKGLYYLFLGLVAVAAVIAVGIAIGVAVGVIPVQIDAGPAEGPVRVLIGLAGSVIGFVAVAASLALALAIIYIVGYFLLAMIILVLVAVVIGLSPVLAPFALLAFFIWWMDKRKHPKRVEPTLQATVEPAPAASTEPGR
ncbi:MAG TPA: histidine kinase, partial [Usitatibacter sp.]|nr:histidine kinase [Usitatibacter sp.]